MGAKVPALIRWQTWAEPHVIHCLRLNPESLLKKHLNINTVAQPAAASSPGVTQIYLLAFTSRLWPFLKEKSHIQIKINVFSFGIHKSQAVLSLCAPALAMLAEWNSLFCSFFLQGQIAYIQEKRSDFDIKHICWSFPPSFIYILSDICSFVWLEKTGQTKSGREGEKLFFYFFFSFDEIFTVRIYQRPEQKVGVSHERLGLTVKNRGVLLPPRGQSGRSQAAVEKPAKTVSQVTRPSHREHSLQTHWGVIWGHRGLSHLLCLKSRPHNRLSSTWILMTSLN